MDPATIPFWSYWYFHIPNYVLAVLMYTLVGRYLMSLFVPHDWNNYIWRFFRLLTDRVVAATAFLVPRAVNKAFLPLVAAFWVMALRAGFFLGMLSQGWAPMLTPAQAG